MKVSRFALVPAFALSLAAPGLAQTAKSPAPSKAPVKAPAKRPPRGPEILTPETLRWGALRASLPEVSQWAPLSGNPDALGRPYAIRLRAADRGTAGPHWHTTDVQFTVIQGTLLLGVGDTFDESKLQKFGPGSYLLIPAGLRHFLGFQGETVYQMQGIGPLKTLKVKSTRPAALAAAPVVDTQKFKAEFDAAVAAFNQAVQTKDRNALNNQVRQEFDRIARGSGPYAAAARDYLNARIPAELVQRGPCPAIARPANVGWVVQDVKPGDTVAPALLDQKLEWLSCAWPEFPPRPASGPVRSGVVRLTLTINETGNVISTAARGGVYPPGVFEAAAAAVRAWRSNPPRAKGHAVRTEVSVDIPYSQP